MRPGLGALLVVMLLAASKPTDAAQIDVRALAAGCASCHQPTERVPPPLAGQSRAALIAKLRGFRDGSVPGTVMPVIANGYTPGELAALARHFADMPPAR